MTDLRTKAKRARQSMVRSGIRPDTSPIYVPMDRQDDEDHVERLIRAGGFTRDNQFGRGP